ncbi:hypothetical protein [Luteimonas viscosa]|uniref:hypothetical protein n=1 Tax=Luteimonas viscosa TaxID=1132694 RepID=UPI00165492D4|nr:hypothetical protein [Luteimonas viscosa]
MKLRNIESTTWALLVAGLFVLAIGRWTDNGGFRLAGGMLIVVALILALAQAAGGKPED